MKQSSLSLDGKPSITAAAIRALPLAIILPASASRYALLLAAVHTHTHLEAPKTSKAVVFEREKQTCEYLDMLLSCNKRGAYPAIALPFPPRILHFAWCGQQLHWPRSQ
ncbi:hypothetical protein P3342_008400 [Pyrenophora teres f. teres]|nr:hypothetical protein P3342_008400 [Pyrenophora teres f. teres]